CFETAWRNSIGPEGYKPRLSRSTVLKARVARQEIMLRREALQPAPQARKVRLQAAVNAAGVNVEAKSQMRRTANVETAGKPPRQQEGKLQPQRGMTIRLPRPQRLRRQHKTTEMMQSAGVAEIPRAD